MVHIDVHSMLRMYSIYGIASLYVLRLEGRRRSENEEEKDSERERERERFSSVGYYD